MRLFSWSDGEAFKIKHPAEAGCESREKVPTRKNSLKEPLFTRFLLLFFHSEEKFVFVLQAVGVEAGFKGCLRLVDGGLLVAKRYAQ